MTRPDALEKLGDAVYDLQKEVGLEVTGHLIRNMGELLLQDARVAASIRQLRGSDG